jgi:hypothetical protein
MIWSTSGEGRILQQMNHSSQIAQEILLELLITYFTQVGAWSLTHCMCSLLFYVCSFCISIFLNKIIGSNCAYSFHDGHVCPLSADSLTVDSLLELLDEESLRKDTALPSPEWSSDHIALLAEFRCKPRIRRWRIRYVTKEIAAVILLLVGTACWFFCWHEWC